MFPEPKLNLDLARSRQRDYERAAARQRQVAVARRATSSRLVMLERLVALAGALAALSGTLSVLVRYMG